VAEQELQPGDPASIGSHKVLARLGSGGMGVVFLGQTPGGRRVAIKAIRREFASDPEFRRRFRLEITAARQVNGLYTAVVVDADPDAPEPWFATAYVPGPSLMEVVQQNGPLAVESVLALAAGLAEALQAIHSAGVLHRDLKPSNVLMADDGPRVIDFGISRSYGTGTLTSPGQLIGTPEYMSPEQATGEPLTPASDVFSFGSVLAFAATGKSPFRLGAGGDTLPGLIYALMAKEADLSAVPAQLRPLIAACLAKDSARRPTPSQLLDQLDRLNGGIGPSATLPPGAATPSRTYPAVGSATVGRPDPGTVRAGGPALPAAGRPGNGPEVSRPRRRWLGIFPQPGKRTSRNVQHNDIVGTRPFVGSSQLPTREPPDERPSSPPLITDTTYGVGDTAFIPADRLPTSYFRSTVAPDAVDSAPAPVSGTVDEQVDPNRVGSRVEFFIALNTIRERSGLSPRDVAILIGLPVTTVRGYFESKRLPAERDVLRQILVACGTSPATLPLWDMALVRVRSQRRNTATGKARSPAAGQSDQSGFDQPDDPADDPLGSPADDESDLLFRVYIPKTQLYAEQRRQMLRLFREWLANVHGQGIRHEDIPSRDGDTVAFFAVPGQPRPPLSAEYSEFVSFVQHCAHSPGTAVGRLAESGLSEVTSSDLVTKYSKEYHRMDMDLRQARETRILTLQHTLEAELLERDADPHTVASLRIRSVLEQVVPPPSAAPSLPAIAAPGVPPQPTQVNMTFNAEQIVYTAVESIQGTANFGPQAKDLLALINQYGGGDAGQLRTALHEIEDPEVPHRLRADAKTKLKSFLADLARQIPGIGVDLLQKYLEKQLGLPGA
jgi:serine/threonine protein kinase